MPTDTAADEKTRLIENVRTFDHDIHQFDVNIKTLREQAKELTERLPEHADIEQLAAQLKAAREKLHYRLLNTPGYNDLMEKLADEKDAKRQADLNMSDFLLAYHADTRERQIELAPKDSREVVLKAKLGKPKDYQLGIFNQAEEA